MKIHSIDNSIKPNFKGDLILKNVRSDMFERDYKALHSITKRLVGKPYDITLEKGDSFGYYFTTVKHFNGKEANMGPFSIPLTGISISDFLKQFIDLLEINNTH